MKANLLRPILAILILFIPLYPKFPLSPIPGTYVAIRLDDIVVLIAIITWLIYQSTHHFPVLKIKISKLFLAYFLAIIASNVTAILIYQTNSPHLLLLHLLRRLEYMSLFFITLDALPSTKDLSFPFISLIIANVFVYIYGYGQKYYHFPVVSTMNSEFSKGQLLQMDVWTRISSTFSGHYDLAAYLSFVLIIILGVILTQFKNRFVQFILILIWLSGFHILTLTASRISVFAFWGGIVLALFLIRKYLWIIPVSALVISSILSSRDLNQRLIATLPTIRIPTRVRPTVTPTIAPTAPPVTTPAPTKKPIPTKRTTPTPTRVPRPTATPEYPPLDTDIGVARSGEIRFNAEWPRAITAYRRNPVTGSGLGSITLATDNDYLRLLGESGLTGFITFLLIPLYLVIQTLPIIFKPQLTRFNCLSLIFCASVLVILANATFIDVFEASKTAYTFWIMLGLYHQSLKFDQKQ